MPWLLKELFWVYLAVLMALYSGINAPFPFSILNGIGQVANERHYNIQTVATYQSAEEEIAYIDDALERNVGGLIVYTRPEFRNQAVTHHHSPLSGN